MKNKYKELKRCKTFGDIYCVIGEDGFGRGAEVLLKLFCISPILAGLVNFYMLLDIYSYNAYTYNDRFMIISNTVFTLITLYFIVYLAGKIGYNKWNISDIIAIIRKKEPWLLFWICLMIWTILSCVASVNIRGAFFGATELSSGYISHIYMLCIMGCASLLPKKNERNLISFYIAISDLLAVIMLAFQYDIPFIRRFTAASGLSVFTNSNHYGYYLAVASTCLAGMFFMSIEERKAASNKNLKSVVIYLASFVIHSYALMINDTMGAFVAIFISTIVLIILWCIRIRDVRWYHFLPIMILMIMVLLCLWGVITSKSGSTIGISLIYMFYDITKIAGRKPGYQQAGTDRIRLWLESIEAIKKNPILGYGPDVMYDRYWTPYISLTPHNEYLECALYMGIPGAIMYLGGLISLFICRIKRLKQLPLSMIVAAGAVISYLISAFFGVRKYHTVAYLFMFIGLIFLKNEKNEENGKSRKKKTR